MLSMIRRSGCRSFGSSPPAPLGRLLRTHLGTLAGTPLHSQGKLTILDLAREAQVKRWIVTHKYPIRLMAKYQAEFKASQREPEKETAERREIDKLREALAKAREEKCKLTDLVQTYAIIPPELHGSVDDIRWRGRTPSGGHQGVAESRMEPTWLRCIDRRIARKHTEPNRKKFMPDYRAEITAKLSQFCQEYPGPGITKFSAGHFTSTTILSNIMAGRTHRAEWEALHDDDKLFYEAYHECKAGFSDLPRRGEIEQKVTDWKNAGAGVVDELLERQRIRQAGEYNRFSRNKLEYKMQKKSGAGYSTVPEAANLRLGAEGGGARKVNPFEGGTVSSVSNPVRSARTLTSDPHFSPEEVLEGNEDWQRFAGMANWEVDERLGRPGAGLIQSFKVRSLEVRSVQVGRVGG
ncbi:hypothetical protein [Streptomyces sp. NPDC058394]|uniref:hypothetical protein n=1 Tax=Streptomyces sp. NPDC058394 TaxID=3346477 RepID=UPI003659E195